MVNLKIDDKKVCVPEGTTILEAAKTSWDRYTYIMLFKRYK